MTFTERTQSSASFTPRETTGEYERTVGSMSEDEWVALLGATPTFETPVPQAGGKLFGALTFDDVIDLRDTLFTGRTPNPATFTPRNIS